MADQIEGLVTVRTSDIDGVLVLPFPSCSLFPYLPFRLVSPRGSSKLGHRTLFGAVWGKTKLLKHFRLLMSCMSDTFNYFDENNTLPVYAWLCRSYKGLAHWRTPRGKILGVGLDACDPWVVDAYVPLFRVPDDLHHSAGGSSWAQRLVVGYLAEQEDNSINQQPTN